MGVLSDLAYRMMAWGPVMTVRRQRLAASGITVFMYHDVGPDRDDVDVWQIVRRSDFLRQIDYLRRHYQIVDLETALRAINEPPTPKPLAVLTFDDGHRGNIEYLLPIVQQEDLPVTLYIATGHVESGQPYWFDRMVNHLQSNHPVELDLRRFGMGVVRFNEERGAHNWAKIQKLLVSIKSLPVDQCDPITDEIIAQLPQLDAPAMSPLKSHEVKALAQIPQIVIGAHTHGHEVLTKLSVESARETIAHSVTKLTEWTGQVPRHFAYPAGFQNNALQQLVAEMGFVSAMSTETGIWHRHHSAFLIPRISVGRYDNMARFMVNALRG